ncbi:glycoside hydrolase family 20 zincin-like fold domain-containing protein [Allobaculum sp. Allo2]|uniref:glycoside hydrolase family 20 zincin-like fold domain-containing protein n=1 Tax=Allobaculum sp. Allo2 TaxID=2853432 RepID=UPI001F6005AB|nr:glycoside hydrolase family 20 zincin-like fold domain-containing protein [Allobaculum sp. Allo2]UNT93177.1 glycoside hydrolase family 20 zincin-like fold domain-containing protein [Allobaculum sp. Allo2]
MRKTSRKIASSFLAAAMLIPSFSLPAAASEPDTGAASAEYKIYPTPQSVVYGTGATTVSKDVHVVYSAGIDQFTKDHAKEVFALLGQDVTLSEGDTPEEGKTNLLVGIQGEESPQRIILKPIRLQPKICLKRPTAMRWKSARERLPFWAYRPMRPLRPDVAEAYFLAGGKP